MHRREFPGGDGPGALPARSVRADAQSEIRGGSISPVVCFGEARIRDPAPEGDALIRIKNQRGMYLSSSGRNCDPSFIRRAWAASGVSPSSIGVVRRTNPPSLRFMRTESDTR